MIPIYRALRSRCMRARANGSSQGRVEGSSRVMLATARPSCVLILRMALEVNGRVQRSTPPQTSPVVSPLVTIEHCTDALLEVTYVECAVFTHAEPVRYKQLDLVTI